MKLHLPKALLTAVLAVYVSPATWATSDDTANSGWGKIWDEWNKRYSTDVYSIGDATIETIDTADSTHSGTTLYLRSDNGISSATVGSLIVSAGDTLNIDGWWESNDTHPEFSNLVVNALTLNSNSKLNIFENNTVTLNGNHTFSSSGQVTGAGTLVIGDGANVTVSLSDGKAAIQSAISVSGGGKLIADANDRLGWGTTATKSITLAGTSADKKAVFELGGRQTLATELHMDGNAAVTAFKNETSESGNDQAGLNAYKKNGAIIDVTGTNNEIAAALHTRGSFHITVAEAGELLVSGQVLAVGDVTGDCGYDSGKNPNGYEVGSIVKLGEGKITFSNASNEFTKKYFHEAGETVINATAKFNNGIKITGGEFTLNADITLGSGKNIELTGGTLNLNNTNAAQILTGTTGSGNITIGTNITLGNNTATQVTGGLTIESGKTLQVGNGTGHSSTIASFSSVKLDGGTLKFHNNGSTVHNLTVSKESTLHVQDMNAGGSIILLDDTTTLDAKLNVTSSFKGTLQIEKLTGTGDLDIKAGNNGYNDTLRVNIDALDSYTGKISYTASAWGNSIKSNNILTIKSEKDFALSGLNVLAGKSGENYTTASAVIEAKGKADLGDVKVTNGSSVTLQRNNGRFYVELDSLEVVGSAIVQTASGTNTNNSYETEFSIGKLVGTDATLKLRSGSNTTAATVFNLNGGEGSNFSGAIEVGGYNDGDGRKAVLNINDSTIASNAEIRFNAENAKNTAYLALGADNVAVKGISDVAGVAGAAQIVSGEVTVGTTGVKSDGTVRTLTINTQGNSYSTAAKIDKNVNLVKSGEGKQTFSGDVSAFNGSVTVKKGELALTGTSTLSLTQLSLFDTTNATGGTLSVGSANGGTVSIVSAGDKVGSVVVGKDSILNGNLTLGAGTALTLNGYGDNAATINGTLTLGTGMQVSGLEQLLNDLAAQEAGADGLKSLKLFNVSAVNFGTVEATLAMAADALVEEQPLIAGYDAANYFSTLSVGEYALVFQNSALYIQATAPIPEPTTATLSLLALTALAARRRRK